MPCVPAISNPSPLATLLTFEARTYTRWSPPSIVRFRCTAYEGSSLRWQPVRRRKALTASGSLGQQAPRCPRQRLCHGGMAVQFTVSGFLGGCCVFLSPSYFYPVSALWYSVFSLCMARIDFVGVGLVNEMMNATDTTKYCVIP